MLFDARVKRTSAAKLGMSCHQCGVMMHLEILTASCKSTVDDETESDTVYWSSAGKGSCAEACTSDHHRLQHYKQSGRDHLFSDNVKAKNQDNKGDSRKLQRLIPSRFKGQSETSTSAQKKKGAPADLNLLCAEGSAHLRPPARTAKPDVF